MKLIPKTLQVRIVLLLLLFLAGGQYAAFRIFAYFEIEPRAEAAALQIVSTVNLTRAALLAASEERRLPLLQELNQREGIRVYPFDIFEEIEPLPDSTLLKRMVGKVTAQLGDDTIVAVNHLGVPGIWVSFFIGGDDYWLVMPRVQPANTFPWQWLGWAALVVALSVCGAWFIMRRINRPLRALTRAADTIGRGGMAEALPEEGAQEFGRVTHAFNTMTQALARAEADRNLLLGGISHDLRTPLSRLRLAVEIAGSPSSANAWPWKCCRKEKNSNPAWCRTSTTWMPSSASSSTSCAGRRARCRKRQTRTIWWPRWRSATGAMARRSSSISAGCRRC